MKVIGYKRAVSIQGKKNGPIMSFSETLIGAQLKYATFEKELHAIVRALDVWKP